NTCFSPAMCLQDASPPIPIDPATCTFALPGTAGTPDAGAAYPFPTHGTGLNVRAYYDDGSYSEVLDLEPNEGFFVPDPSKPQTSGRAPDLCPPPASAVHRIVAIEASGLCPSKTPFQPICDAESPSTPLSDASAPADDAGGSAAGGRDCSLAEIKPAPSALI